MNIKSLFNKYEKAHREIEHYHKEADKFFSDLGLDYAFTYCKGDGVMILDCYRGLCGHINGDQLDRLSKSKTGEQALVVLSEIEFSC